jgi:Ca2+-binding RTX toxin-like protein
MSCFANHLKTGCVFAVIANPIANASGSTTVTASVSVDSIIAGAGQDNFRFISTADSAAGDTITNFDAGSDTFTFTRMVIGGGSMRSKISALVKRLTLASEEKIRSKFYNI